MPASFPVIELVDETPARTWRARCRTCGWTSKPSTTKTAVDYERRLHGKEVECDRPEPIALHSDAELIALRDAVRAGDAGTIDALVAAAAEQPAPRELAPAVLAEGGRLISCSSCDSSLAVYGDAQLQHHDDGSHTVTYGPAATDVGKQIDMLASLLARAAQLEQRQERLAATAIALSEFDRNGLIVIVATLARLVFKP